MACKIYQDAVDHLGLYQQSPVSGSHINRYACFSDTTCPSNRLTIL
jgi:hypothetical protein